MFKKPYKLKSQNQLKTSEKKKFISDFKSFFPHLNETDITNFLSNKENVVRLKVTTFKNDDVDVYCINRTPVYIDIISQNLKLPTVYMLWKYPHMLPTVTTNKSVLSKLKNGADLFCPGIYIEGLYACDLDFLKMTPICVNLIDNKAVVAVGISLIDKKTLLEKTESEGKLMQVYHTVDDYLFQMQSDSTLLQLGPPEWAPPNSNDVQRSIDVKNLNEVESKASMSNIKSEENQDSLHIKDTESTVVTEDTKNLEPKFLGDSTQDTEDDSSGLLEYCFLKAIKGIPKTAYPILPATFYAKYILGNLPEGKSINLKKTKWKKFSVFLQEKGLSDLIKLQPIPKNEFTIASGNTEHPLVKGFIDPFNAVSVTVESSVKNRPTVQQVYLVSAATLPFFSKFGLKKNDELTRNDVRVNVNNYIKSENLADPNKPEMVILDPILYQILKKETLSRAGLLTELLQKMNTQHKVSNCLNGDTILHKGKMPSIEFEICLRTGNKKVTLISNLESYGVNAVNFSKELQHKAAASTTIIPSVPGKKGPQVQVQGNQIAVAFVILKEKYHLTEKNTKGLEKAVKSKTKK